MKNDFLEYIAGETDDGIKLDSILKSRLNLSRRMIIGLKKNNCIYINGKPEFVNYLVRKGDEVLVNIAKEENQDIKPQDIPIDIAYEDGDLLIVNKQPGIVVHPTRGHPEGTLANGIIFYFREKNESTIVRLVNRLDRDTSGLILIAKNQFSHQAMAKQLDLNQIDKIYLAVVHGIVKENEGTIDLPIDRPERESIKREVMTSGYKAVTHFKVLERLKDASLLEIKLETGKTHQIRVHMSHIGHPLFSDTLYGCCDDSKWIMRQALHAFMLSFNHPRTGEKLCIKAEIPSDIQILLNELKK